jgi:hypothetical protein
VTTVSSVREFPHLHGLRPRNGNDSHGGHGGFTGTDTIGTIAIETMIELTTAIDPARFFSGDRNSLSVRSCFLPQVGAKTSSESLRIATPGIF